MNSITIGRSKECDIVVTGDDTVSGVHCRINRVGDKYVFENLGRNGSTLNGQVLNGPTPIAANAPVMIGARTQLPWPMIQRLLPIGPIVAAQAPQRPAQRPAAPRPMAAPAPAPVYTPEPVVYPEYDDYNPEDTTGFGWWILSFFFPVVGIVLFFVWKNSKPNRARKSCLIPALINIAIEITGFILSSL